jgi:haloalkane dehalogenase
VVRPGRWSDFGEGEGLFRALRSPAGEQLVLDQNIFVERVLPGGVLRTLDEAEMERYRAPYREREARWPTLVWPRQIPIDGEPADVHARIEAIGRFLATTPIPKLFINVEPGLAMTERERAFARTFPNQTEVTVRGLHFAQEDSPDAIGAALADFVRRPPVTPAD